MNGLTTKSTAKESICGKMDVGTMASGSTTIWRALVCISGPTEDAMKANTLMIRSADTAFTIGQMDADMKAGG